MRFLSLFSGIGGFDHGFERAGMTCVAQVEIDTHAGSVLKKHWPDVQLIKDVKNVGRTTIGAVDLICGGFPCQDVSLAGKREGLAGERSGLWFEFIRIIEELKPQWVVIENVPGLLSSNKGRDFAVILQGLAQSGYGVAWRVLDAQYFGLAQRRKRVFIVGSFGDGRAAQVLFERQSSPWRSAPQREIGEISATLPASGDGTSRTGNQRTEREMMIPAAFSGRDLKLESISPTIQAGNKGQSPNTIPMVMAHGQANAEVLEDQAPTLNTNHEQPILAFTARLDGSDAQDNISPTLRSLAKSSNGHQSGPSGAAVAWKIRGGKEGGGKGFLGSEQTAFALDTHNTQYWGVRRFTPTECERLQGFPDGWTADQSDTQRYKQLGNAVAVPVAEWIGRRIMEAE
jgi:DNA (cytosine-5)-methyltransferase 1